MKTSRIRAGRFVSAMLAGGVALSAVLGPALLPADFGGSAARADVVVNIDLFHRELSPYGRWARDARYGDVWYPANVRQGWRPYYDDGHWVYSDDYGWLWVAEQPWGWAPFHYGRWVLTDYGWAWVPGSVWGPAWVTFRSAPDYIGWAPLPPEADWDDGYGFRHRYAVDDDRYWSFVRPQGFLERRFDRYAYDRRDNRRFIQHTTNITNITIVNKRVVNRGIDVSHVERETHRRVQRVKVTDSDRPSRTQVQGNKVVVYKPAITDPARNERLNSGSVKSGEQGVTSKKKRRDNLPAENANQGAPAQQFVAPNGQAGDADQLPTKKKKRNAGNATQQQFAPEKQMQPSAGVTETEQLPVKKKKKRSSNANINGGAQQPQTFQNNGGAPESGDQVPRKKKRQKQQFGNQQQQEQQPQVKQQKRQVQQQDQQQNNTKHRQKKQNSRQCQQGDTGACGN